MSKLIIPVSTADHIQGNPKASLTLVEYGDYECPYCGEAYPLIKRIQKEFGDRLRFVFRNFPLVEVHPFAGMAAITAEFAGSKNKFWEMHDMLYENQDRLDLPDLLGYAEALKLSSAELQNALENEMFAEKIKNDFMGGVRSGVNGTPCLFINDVRQNSYDYESVVEALRKLD